MKQKKTNHVLFLKSKILSIRMEENEYVVAFISWIKELRDNLRDIGEQVSNIDLVTITLNDMTKVYQMFIIGLATREKSPTFEELTGILTQEEERHKNLKPQNADLALMAKKKFLKGKPVGEHKSSDPSQTKPFQGMSSSKND